MALQPFLPALAFMVVAAAAMPNGKDASCDFTGFDPYAAVSRILAKMPTHTEPSNHKFSTFPGVSIFPGFEIGGLNVTGLDNIEQYGPALPFCVNGSRLLQVDLIHRADVTLSMPWRSCSGMEGSVSLRAELSRFTVQFRLVDSELGNETVLSFVSPVAPVILEGAHVVIEDAGQALKTATGVLSLVFDGVIRDMYNRLFFSSFQWALLKALQ